MSSKSVSFCLSVCLLVFLFVSSSLGSSQTKNHEGIILCVSNHHAVTILQHGTIESFYLLDGLGTDNLLFISKSFHEYLSGHLINFFVSSLDVLHPHYIRFVASVLAAICFPFPLPPITPYPATLPTTTNASQPLYPTTRIHVQRLNHPPHGETTP